MWLNSTLNSTSISVSRSLPSRTRVWSRPTSIDVTGSNAYSTAMPNCFVPRQRPAAAPLPSVRNSAAQNARLSRADTSHERGDPGSK
jgi:hypothetical protein